MKILTQIKLLATDEQIENRIHSDRKHLILQDNKLFNPFKNEYYELSVLSGLDDEIKEGDYIINDNKIYSNWRFDKASKGYIVLSKGLAAYTKDCKKIIATTDLNLEINNNFSYSNLLPNKDNFKFYLPQIPQQFIELFITEYNKGHIITEVEVEYDGLLDDDDNLAWNSSKLKVNQDNTINIGLPVKDDIKEFVNTNYSFFTEDTRNKMILGINAYIKTMK